MTAPIAESSSRNYLSKKPRTIWLCLVVMKNWGSWKISLHAKIVRIENGITSELRQYVPLGKWCIYSNTSIFTYARQ